MLAEHAGQIPVVHLAKFWEVDHGVSYRNNMLASSERLLRCLNI